MVFRPHPLAPAAPMRTLAILLDRVSQPALAAAINDSGMTPCHDGGGVAGFDFTALAASGSTMAPTSHACLHDHVTGLIWSTATLDATWSDGGGRTVRLVVNEVNATPAFAECPDQTLLERMPTYSAVNVLGHGGNFQSTICYSPFSGTFTGPDYFTFVVADKDGNESTPGTVTIEIFEF